MARVTLPCRSPVPPAWRRRLASVLAIVFFVAGSAEAVALHRCEHHDAVPGQDAPAGHAAHAAHAEPGAPAPHDAPCRCIGDCHAGASAPVAVAAPAGLSLVSGAGVARVTPPVSHVPVPPPHFLPFANPPPVSRSH